MIKTSKTNPLKEYVSSKYFWFVAAIMAVKLILMGLFSSDYQDLLFIPFVNDFIKNGGNVYQRFYENGITNSFPYPPIMLLIESTGAKLIELLGVSGNFWVNFLFKLPSFIFDFAGLLILVKFFPEKRRYTAVFYYASPIVIYSVYMHGQLDIIPMVMLIASLSFFVSKKDIRYRYVFGTLFTIMAILCKLHIFAALPIIFFYLQKRDGLAKAFGYIFGAMAGVMAGIVPVMSEGFTKTVLLNAEQSVLTKVFLRFDSVALYVPIAAVFFIYLLTFRITYMNRELFLNLCGIVFAVFLAFCPPMPGWYVWIVPFVTLFFTSINEEKYKNIILYVALNGLYLIYFVFLHNRGYVDLYFLKYSLASLKYDDPLLSNGIFTLLSALLIYLLVAMYRLGVASNNFYKRRNVPFTIGIAGDSGAGKTTMIDVVEKGLGVANILYIEGDGDHRWERGNRSWDDYTALNPKANYLYRQAKDLADLQSGTSIKRVDYDHNTGRFTEPKRFRSKKYIILCGLHALYLPQTRKHLDLKIYMDSDETLRRYWKIQRDTTQRGHSKEAVLKSIEERMPDAEKFIYPQKKYADLIVKYYDKNLTNCMADNYTVNMSVILTLSAAIDIEPLVNELRGCGISVEYDYSEDLNYQNVTLDADNIEKITLPVESIAKRVIPQLEEITREDLNEEINAKDGIIILFLLILISNKMQGVL